MSLPYLIEIVTPATVPHPNLPPSVSGVFCVQVHSALEDSLRGLEPFLLVDVVWSLCVLQQVKPHYCLSLARPEYRASLSGL
jgi:hypothetical protein